VVRTALTDKDIVRLSMGDTAEVTMDAFPDEVFGAVVSELGTVADPVTGTYEAELQILQPRPRFRTGFISRVSIFPAGTEQSLVIPLESLLNASGSMASVYLYSEADPSREGEAIPEGEITRVRVRTGRILDSLIVVTEGLTEGQWVVTDGAKYLNRHSRVNAVNYKRP
jgi:multidrug efflux pump subunit AcrA (membrane-fusion protein)